MAGTVVASTINNDTGLFSTNNAYLGIAKAWVCIDTAGTIQASFNVSSVTISSNTRIVNFTTAMANANYTYTALGESTSGAQRLFIRNTALTKTTTQLQMDNVYANNATVSPSGEGFVCTVFGN
jgi:hypothetical protein